MKINEIIAVETASFALACIALIVAVVVMAALN